MRSSPVALVVDIFRGRFDEARSATDRGGIGYRWVTPSGTRTFRESFSRREGKPFATTRENRPLPLSDEAIHIHLQLFCSMEAGSGQCPTKLTLVRIHAGEPYFRFNNLEVECYVFVQTLYRSPLSARRELAELIELPRPSSWGMESKFGICRWLSSSDSAAIC